MRDTIRKNWQQLVVATAIDNFIKRCIRTSKFQNMNLMFGLDESNRIKIKQHIFKNVKGES